ncbi:prolipoprotein diacylglyceryl transferase [Oceanotoga sp. DSM 15011]|uniref:prolipoprotein diacylglyceryl transferase n=1 Tax=Oceanotoga sp. DSM 15011 TaxID=2984951 RepID=UPI0021F3CDE8|nr:prolipoprotein diacylglyceryl transferase [Oceanotoga sp. DSM 15011]UYP00232.1 prolipoprotein diacylglyceryl transferase [Oceanotoga sp. DSM 15011]
MHKDKYFKIMSISTLTIFIVACITLLPPRFKGNISYNDTIFTLGSISIKWYGLLISSSILIATLIALKQSRREKILEDDLINAIIIGIVVSVISARLYYVLFNLDYFSKNPSEILKTYHGGMAIHGAILGAILSTYLYTKFKKNSSIKFLQGTDLFTHVLPLSQAIGRWGNFFNNEAYGTPTNLPWKMFVESQNRMPGYEKFEFFHPTFLYESFFDLIIFLILLYYIRNKREKFGEVTALYMMLYSIIRGNIELLRTDSLYIGNIKQNVLISIVLFIIGLILFINLKKKRSVNIEKK